METNNIESFWVFALASKCQALSSQNTLILILLLCMAWLAISILYWAHPGGPAWGRYRWNNGGRKRKITPTADVATITNPTIPGPRGFPILGSLHLMANLAHRRLASAAAQFGSKRLMACSLGETRVVITSDPDVAREILNSSAFADRPIKESAYSLMFNRAIGFAPYGVYWRTLRRIAATHLFSPKQISASETQRFRIADQMVAMINNNIACDYDIHDDHDRGRFCVRDVLKKASLHNMMGSVFGREYELGSWNAESNELSRLVEEGYKLLGKLNWSDHLPWIGSLDLQRIRFRCSQLVPKVNRFVSRIIQEHRANNNNSGGNNHHDFVDVLLSLHGPDKLSDHDMIAVLWVSSKNYKDTFFIFYTCMLRKFT